MGDPLRKIQKGAKLSDLSAEAWNRFCDLAKAANDRRHDQTQRPGRIPALGNIVRVRNNSGVDVDRFGVLGIDDPLISADDDLESFQSDPALIGVTPTVAAHTGKFVILLEPAADGDIVDAFAAGLAICQVLINDDTDRFADVLDGDDTRLTSGATGTCRILALGGTGAGSGSGSGSGSGPITEWCLVAFGGGAGGGANDCRTINGVDFPSTFGVYDATTSDWVFGFVAEIGCLGWFRITRNCPTCGGSSGSGS